MFYCRLKSLHEMCELERRKQKKLKHTHNRNEIVHCSLIYATVAVCCSALLSFTLCFSSLLFWQNGNNVCLTCCYRFRHSLQFSELSSKKTKKRENGSETKWIHHDLFDFVLMCCVFFFYLLRRTFAFFSRKPEKRVILMETRRCAFKMFKMRNSFSSCFYTFFCGGAKSNRLPLECGLFLFSVKMLQRR